MCYILQVSKYMLDKLFILALIQEYLVFYQLHINKKSNAHVVKKTISILQSAHLYSNYYYF